MGLEIPSVPKELRKVDENLNLFYKKNIFFNFLYVKYYIWVTGKL